MRDEQPLADGRGGLLRREVARPGRQPERAEAGGDRAGGHEHHLAAGGPAGGEHVDERVQPLGVEAAVGRR